MQMKELCSVWVMTEESLKRYSAYVLVPFPANQKCGIFDFILNLNTTKSRHRTTILSYVSLQSFSYSLVFIKLQCKLLILATVKFKWPCTERTSFWHRLIVIYPSDSEHERPLNCLRIWCMFQNTTNFPSFYATKNAHCYKKTDRYKDGCYWKRILWVGRSV